MPRPGETKLIPLSFDDLLARLQEAHQLELQDLRRENDALNAEVKQLRGKVRAGSRQLELGGGESARAAEGAHTSSWARALKPPKTLPEPPPDCEEPSWSAAVYPVALDNAMKPPEMDSTMQQPEMDGTVQRPRTDDTEQHRGMEKGTWKSWAIGGSRFSRNSNDTRRTSIMDIEIKSLDFQALCVEKYPNHQWKELATHEQVELIREALKPTSRMMNPRSAVMRYWDTLVVLALVFVGTVTPYEVVFINEVNWTFFVVNRVVDTAFVLDIILQFFLMVEVQRPHRGGSIMLRDPYTLRMRYLKSWFFIDVVSIFPYDIFGLVLTTSVDVWQRAKILRVLKLVRLAKLLRMLRTSRILQRRQDAIAMQFATQKIVKFCVILCLISHWMACLWGLCGLTIGTELCDDQGQLVDFGDPGIGISQVSWVTTLYVGGKTSPDTPCKHFDVYTASLHWAVMTITSIGYGDIVPVRLEEYIVGVICMLAGSFMWAYVIGSLCSILSNSSAVEKSFEANTDLLNLAMAEAHVPHRERPKYREYLREAKAYDRRVSFGQVAERFSPMLRKHLMLHVSKDALDSVAYFNDPEAPETFLMDVASRLVPKFFSRGEPLDSLRHCLCMMDRGTVGHGGMVLVPPNVFHEDFIITQKRFHRVKRTISLTYTQVLVLTREELEAILEHYPAFARKLRRRAVSMAFARAVCMTMAAHRSWTRSTPSGGAHMSLSEAFDKAFGWRDEALANP